MGTYYFTCATTGDVSRVEYIFERAPHVCMHMCIFMCILRCMAYIQVSRVEYTFGYKRSDDDGKPRIFLHHSSVPYKA